MASRFALPDQQHQQPSCEKQQQRRRRQPWEIPALVERKQRVTMPLPSSRIVQSHASARAVGHPERTVCWFSRKSKRGFLLVSNSPFRAHMPWVSTSGLLVTRPESPANSQQNFKLPINGLRGT